MVEMIFGSAAIAELAAQQLAGHGLGQLVEELDLAGVFVRRR
jgi:hypothetical protein